MSISTPVGFVPFSVIIEPCLQFGKASSSSPGEAIDPQLGLSTYGPFSSRIGGKWHPLKVRLIPVCSQLDFEAVCDSLERLQDFEKISEASPYARVDYPGFEAAFRAKLEVHRDLKAQSVSPDVFQSALNERSAATGYRRVVDTI